MDDWAVKGDGETPGRLLGGGRDVEQGLEEPAAHAALWLECTGVGCPVAGAVIAGVPGAGCHPEGDRLPS